MAKSTKKPVEDHGAGVQQGLSSREGLGQKMPRSEGTKGQRPTPQRDGRLKY